VSYLDIARAALADSEKCEKTPLLQTSARSERSSGGEISEQSEKSPGGEPCPLPLTSDEVEQLKARIIAAVTVDPAEFDREKYDVLMATWVAHEATLDMHALASEPA
jgi:hypothetical protein